MSLVRIFFDSFKDFQSTLMFSAEFWLDIFITANQEQIISFKKKTDRYSSDQTTKANFYGLELSLSDVSWILVLITKPRSETFVELDSSKSICKFRFHL